MDIQASYFIGVILQSCEYIGEVEFLRRIEIACKNLGWKCQSYLPKDRQLKVDQPDFIISLIDHTRYHRGCPNYLWLSHGASKYFDDTGKLRKEQYKYLHKYDGFLTCFREVDLLEKYVISRRKYWWHWNKQTFRHLPWYPTVPATPYRPVLPRTKLFYCGDTWDRTRASDKYRQFFQQLDQAGYFEVYGPSERWTHVSRSAKGLIPIDGRQLVQTIQRCGIALLLHSERHLNSAAPTARIFEAAAAGSVIISDRHPFILEHFGDSVLYIDQFASADEMFVQINEHVKFIFNCPEKAESLAVQAHALFLKCWTLEQQLKNIICLNNLKNKLFNLGILV